MNLTLPTDSNERKEIPITSGVLRYFPAALAGVARVSKEGNDKHSPGEPLHHARGKSMDHADCIVRHLMDVQDLLAFLDRVPSHLYQAHREALLPEASQLCWRALALSQELHERFGAPLAPGARLPSKLEAWTNETPERAAGVALHIETARATEDAWAKAHLLTAEACGIPHAPLLKPGFPITPGVYRDRGGKSQTVLEIDENLLGNGPHEYPARGYEHCWNLKGQYWNDPARESRFDLLERIGDLPA